MALGLLGLLAPPAAAAPPLRLEIDSAEVALDSVPFPIVGVTGSVEFGSGLVASRAAFRIGASPGTIDDLFVLGSGARTAEVRIVPLAQADFGTLFPNQADLDPRGDGTLSATLTGLRDRETLAMDLALPALRVRLARFGPALPDLTLSAVRAGALADRARIRHFSVRAGLSSGSVEFRGEAPIVNRKIGSLDHYRCRLSGLPVRFLLDRVPALRGKATGTLEADAEVYPKSYSGGFTIRRATFRELPVFERAAAVTGIDALRAPLFDVIRAHIVSDVRGTSISDLEVASGPLNMTGRLFIDPAGGLAGRTRLRFRAGFLAESKKLRGLGKLLKRFRDREISLTMDISGTLDDPILTKRQ